MALSSISMATYYEDQHDLPDKSRPMGPDRSMNRLAEEKMLTRSENDRRSDQREPSKRLVAQDFVELLHTSQMDFVREDGS